MTLAPVLLLLLSQSPDAGVPPMTPAEVNATLELNCQSCHSLQYIQQQRLSAGQWTATLTKMRGWGALLEEAQLAPLSAALAQSRGPDAALIAFPVQEVAPFRPEPKPKGDRTRGQALFLGRCFACHGGDGRGGIGVNITDRPILQQPTRFMAYVKAGRGRMPPQVDLTAAQFGDLLAWLETR